MARKKKKKKSGSAPKAPNQGRESKRFSVSLKKLRTYNDGNRVYKKGTQYVVAEDMAQRLSATGYFDVKPA